MRHFTVNLFCMGMDASTVYLILTDHPYFAGAFMFFNMLIAHGMYDESTSFSKTSIPFFTYTPAYMSGIAAIIFLIQYSHTYWAIAKFATLFLGVGGSLISVVNNSNRIYFFPGGILMAFSGLAACTYLVVQNHPFWATAIIIMTFIYILSTLKL